MPHLILIESKLIDDCRNVISVPVAVDGNHYNGLQIRNLIMARFVTDWYWGIVWETTFHAVSIGGDGHDEESLRTSMAGANIFLQQHLKPESMTYLWGLFWKGSYKLLYLLKEEAYNHHSDYRLSIPIPESKFQLYTKSDMIRWILIFIEHFILIKKSAIKHWNAQRIDRTHSTRYKHHIFLYLTENHIFN